MHVTAPQPLLAQPEPATQSQAPLVLGTHVDLHTVQPNRPQEVIENQGHRQTHDSAPLPGAPDPVAHLGAAGGAPGDRIDGDLTREGTVDLDDERHRLPQPGPAGLTAHEDGEGAENLSPADRQGGLPGGEPVILRLS